MGVCVELYAMQNLLMDALILCLALRLIQRRTNVQRIGLASAFGAAYACAACLPTISFLRLWCCQAICMLCMCLLVQQHFSRAEFFRFYSFCYLAAAILGGTGLGLMGLLGAQGFGLAHAVLTMLIGGTGLLLLCRPMRENGLCLHEVLMTIDGTTITLQGFMDTGNRLCEPVSGLPVMLVKKERLQTRAGLHMRHVPYESMGNSGLLQAFLPEVLVVDGRIRQWYVAVYPGELEQDALLPPVRERG